MEGMFSYTQAAVERAMKVQEVILRALAKKITWWQAAEIIGISVGRCGAGMNGMKSSGSGGCLIGGGGNRRPRKCRWRWWRKSWSCIGTVSYTHLRAHETRH